MPNSIELILDEHLKAEVSKHEAEEGEFIYLYVRVEPGYEIASATANDNDIDLTGFIMPDSAAYVKLVSRPKIYHISVEKSPNGKLEIDKTSAAFGEPVSVQIYPNNGYYPTMLLGNGVDFYNLMTFSYNFNMPAEDVVLKPIFEKIDAPKFKVGDQVTIIKPGNGASNGISFAAFNVGESAIVYRIVWRDSCKLDKCCYQLQSLDGSQIGYFPEDAIVPMQTSNVFGVGGMVKIIASGNSKPDGSGYTAYGKGYKVKVLSYDPSAEFPFKLGQDYPYTKIQGYYKEDAIE